MAMFKQKKPAMQKKEALLCIPEKNRMVEETILESGDLILSYQSMYKPFFLKVRKFMRPGAKNTFRRKIQLDKLGVHVWSLIDGQKDVQEIIKNFAAFHTLNYREAEISVTLFIKSLGEKGLIGIREP